MYVHVLIVCTVCTKHYFCLFVCLFVCLKELLVRKDELQAAIRREVELIDRYKVSG